MKLNALILIITIALGFGLTYMLETAAPKKEQAQTVKKVKTDSAVLPSFSFTDMEGKTHDASTYAGKYILINFWATWCPPCVKEFPVLLQLAREYPEKLVFLAISSDQDEAAIDRFIKKFDEQNKETLAQDNVILVHDKDSAITFDLFQTARLPETVVVSPEQKMLRKLVGASWDIETVREIIDGKD